MSQKGRDCEDAPAYKAVFVDTNLDTHLAIPASSLDTIFDIKRKLLTEHSKCFGEFGQIEVHALKVKRKGKLYSLSDSVPLTSVFTGTLKGWFLSADISGQCCHNEVVDLLSNKPNAPIFIAGASVPSHLQRGYEKSGRIFQPDEPSAEARSENLQLAVGFRNDGSLKSSSSDSEKRLNTLVKDIYRANCGKDINSSALVPSVNLVKKSVNIGSLEKDKAKKKRNVGVHAHSSNANDAVEIASTDKDWADCNPEVLKNLDLSAADSKQCDHVVTDVRGADQNNIKDKNSSETNHFESLSAELRSGSGACIEQLVDPHSEGKKGIESHGRDMKDLSTGSDKAKGTAKKKNTGMTQLEVMSDNKFIGSDASANVSGKSLATPLGHQLKAIDVSELSGHGTTKEGGLESVSLHMQCNKGTTIPTNMDEAVTEELGMVESVPDAKGSEKEVTTNGSLLESEMMRSKKRKNSGGDVSHQMDIKGKEELAVHENGDMQKGTKMLAEPESTRPLKKSKTGNGTPVAIVMDGVEDGKFGMLSSKQQNQTPKPKKKTRQKQTPAVKKVSESVMKNQSDTTVPEKSKANLSKSASGRDNNDETLSSPHKQMDKVLPVLTSEVDTEMSAKVGSDVLVSDIERDVKPQQKADETICSVAELDSMENTNKISTTKINISQFPVKAKKDTMKRDRSKSAFPKLTTENNDDMEFLPSFQEKLGKAGSVADYNVDIEMTKPVIEVDDKVFVTNHASEICSTQEAEETIQHSAEPMKLTSVQKRGRDKSSKIEKSKKKIKQKPQQMKSVSELPVKGNSTKSEGSRPTLSRSEVEKVENESLSSSAKKINNVSLISSSQADDEISTKVQQVTMTNLGRDVNLQQEEDNACENDIEPLQLTQVQKGRCDTVKDNVQTKKKTKQQQSRLGKKLPDVVKGDQDNSRNDNSLDKDQRAAPDEVSLNAAKNKANIMNPKVESSSLKTKDSDSVINGNASTRVGNTNDSRKSSSFSDMLNKRLHQHKSLKELQKIKQHKLSDKSPKTVVQKPSNKNSLISKCSFFRDGSSSSSEDKSGGDDSNSSTETPNNDHVSSSDYSEEESNSWASPKQGIFNNAGSASNSKFTQKNLTMESVLRSSHKYRKAKLVASQSQLEEDESQAVDFVPESEPNN